MPVGDLIGALVLPLLRNLMGWLENSLEDGKIQKYEVVELGKTFVKLGTPVLFAYFGVEFGNLDPIITILTSFVVVFVDWAYSAFKKKAPAAQ